MPTRTRTALGAATTLLLTAALMPCTAAFAEPGPTLNGFVKLADVPQVGTVVRILDANGKSVASTKTEADGEYSIALPALGTDYFVAANLDFDRENGWTTPTKGALGSFYGKDGAQSFAWQTLDPAQADGDSESLDIDLAAPTAVTGGNSALAKREIYLATLGGTFAGVTQADAEGDFRFQVAPGKYRVLIEPDASYLPFESEPFEVEQGVEEEVDVEPTKGGAITGRITSGGKAVAKAVVRVLRKGEFVDQDKTDAKGYYRVGALEKGDYQVEVGADQGNESKYLFERTAVKGLDLGQVAVVNESVKTGGRVTAHFDSDRTGYFDWTLKRDSTTGKVVRAGSEESYAATLKNPIVVAGLPAGTYVLQAHVAGSKKYAAKTVTVRHGKTTGVGTIAATKRTVKLSGSAPKNSSVSLEPYGADFFQTNIGEVGSDGLYSIPDVVPGRYLARVSDDEHASGAVDLTIQKDTTKDLVGGGAPGGLPGEVVGQVRFRGAPVELGLIGLGEEQLLFVEDGEIERQPITAGTYEVSGVYVGDSASQFQPGVPYYVGWGGQPVVTVVANAVTDLGTVDLVVRG